MKRYERESFIKSFSVFFLSLALLSAVIAWFYHNQRYAAYHDELENRMKLYNYDLKGDDFAIDFVAAASDDRLAELHVGSDEVYALFAIGGSQTNRLKVLYPMERYRFEIGGILREVVLQYALLLAVLLLFSSAYALYALRPMRDALELMETFLKDVIHDLNTPVTAILLNVGLLRKKVDDPALERIALSAQTVGALHRNLETSIKAVPLGKETVAMKKLLQSRCDYFAQLHPKLRMVTELADTDLQGNADALQRIVDNLVSNACKYNRPGGSVEVFYDGRQLQIKDSGVGIRHPEKVFERFYKESERGLGIGMHIVKTLCDALHIGIVIESRLGEGTTVTLTFPVER